MACKVTVRPSGQPVSVTSVTANGVSVTAYTDATLATAVALPLNFNSNTDLWLTNDGQYTVTVTDGGGAVAFSGPVWATSTAPAVVSPVVSPLQVSIDAGAAGLTYGMTLGRENCDVPVGLRSHGAFDNASNGTTDTACTYRYFVPITDASCTEILPGFSNQRVSTLGGAPDADAPNAITIAAAVETSDGTILPFTWNGAHTITIPASGAPIVFPDNPLSFGAQVTATDKFAVTFPLSGVWMRTYVTTPLPTRTDTCGTTITNPTVTDASITAADKGRIVTGTGIPANTYVGTVTPGVSFLLSSSTETQVNVNATATNASVSLSIVSIWPMNNGLLTTGDNYTTAAGGADLTTTGSGAVSGGTGNYMYGPSVVFGRGGKARKPIVALAADSILTGYSDDFHSPYWGACSRAATNLRLPFVKLSRGGETAGVFNAPATRKFMAAMFEGCTHVIVQFGTNDGLLNGGAGVTSLTNILNGICSYFNTMGAKVILATIPPRTTSSDAWATTVNQTPVSGSQITYLAQMNNVIRAGGVTGQSGVYDLADVCMSSRDSGLWAPGSTADGVHPNDAVARGALTTTVQALFSTFTVL